MRDTDFPVEGPEVSNKAAIARNAVSGQEPRVRARNEAKTLRAAIDVFSRKGFDGARIADISRLSGLPHANIHYYFKTKTEIYRRLRDNDRAQNSHLSIRMVATVGSFAPNPR